MIIDHLGTAGLLRDPNSWEDTGLEQQLQRQSTPVGTPATGAAPASESMEKNVNHPTRYTKGKIECIDALDAAVVGKPPDEAICVANVIKYLWRYEEKEPLRSVKSAEWYLKRLIDKVAARSAKYA